MKNLNKLHISYEEATGAPAYGLTNDYMFRAVFQENTISVVLSTSCTMAKNILTLNQLLILDS